MIREYITNWFIGTGRSLGKLLGLELAVELSDHSIKAKMEKPGKSERAWDTSLYKSGNVFVHGYSNPIKPRVNQHVDLDTPDTIEIDEGDTDDAETDRDSPHVQLISSGRYREYMRQDLISQLLTPETRWTKMIYALILIGMLQFTTIITVLYATGGF